MCRVPDCGRTGHADGRTQLLPSARVGHIGLRVTSRPRSNRSIREARTICRRLVVLVER